jgi:(1->4)-alpha-D-glucan 1-alpha-D-glucosylmutase
MNSCILRTLGTDARVPSSTYRLQMHEHFTFDDAFEIVPYLKRLGIGDAYLSPIFRARPHSMHGYDVMQHDCLNPELGDQASFDRFSGLVRDSELGLLLDVVPNHMGVGNDAVWWQDVLENGRSSEFAQYFDIDWEPLKPDMQNKLLLPVLGTQYGEALEAKEIQLEVTGGRVAIAYFEHRFPVAPRTLSLLFSDDADATSRIPGTLQSILSELEKLPPHSIQEAARLRRSQLADLSPRLREVLKSPEIAEFLRDAVSRVNGTKGDSRSFDALHKLLEAQPYRLASWRTSSEQINYRRFFDVNDLVGLRMEEPEVFARTHSLIRKLLAEEKITGLRIDHCDGMFNPRIYLERLQKLFIAAKCKGPVQEAANATAGGIEQTVLEATQDVDWKVAKLPLYCVVEKILEPGEILPRAWAVQGTSGYDFVHVANQFFIQEKNRKRFDEIYTAFLGGNSTNPSRITHESKRNVMLNSLASETHVLTNLLSRLAQGDRRFRDFTDNLLETAIRETIACFPIYRTYIDEHGQYTSTDTTFIRTAIRLGKRRNPDTDASVFDYLQRVLLLEGRGNGDERRDEAALYFALKFQQLTGPVMAKGVEDTSFYVYFRFVSSNEVGSAMDAFGLSAEKLHEANARRLQHTPHSMLTTSTHDTKRSEDVRNRLNVLSEMPDVWASQVNRWSAAHASHKTTLDDGSIAPDANEEYLIYQTIVGAWPWLEADHQGFGDRMKAYIAKALSEGKVNVTWITPHPEYTEAVQTFVHRLLTPADGESKSAFVHQLEELLEPVKLHGAVNSLSQVVLKATCPGVPDFYQGCELWDLSLVDPDNRRPVDYALRTDALRCIDSMNKVESIRCATRDLASGRIKLVTMQRALTARKAHLPDFASGTYLPLEVSHDEHLFAYMRGENIIVVIPRFTFTLMQGEATWPVGICWDECRIHLPSHASGSWINTLSGEMCHVVNDQLRASEVFAHIPIAILARQ